MYLSLLITIIYGPSLLCAKFVWAEFVMCRVCYGPSLLCAEMTGHPEFVWTVFAMGRNPGTPAIVANSHFTIFHTRVSQYVHM